MSHRRAEAKSIALHRAVAERLREDTSLIERARRRVLGWKESGAVHPHYADAWLDLARSPEEVIHFLVDEGERARELRQVTPFAGVLDPRTRWRILREERP